MAYTKVTGGLIGSISDLDLTNVGDIQLDSISGDADTNTSITFSGSDVITIATGGSGRLTIGDGAISPVTDSQIDLGTSVLEFKDAFFDGTLEADAYTVDGIALNEYIADTVGAMVGSNTESGITVAYQDGDNTLDFTVATLNQTTTGSAATLTTARTIGGTSFDGSANIAVATATEAATVTTAAQTNITSVGTLTGLTGATGDLVWDSPTFVVDSSTNRVGIGTTSPDVLLEIAGAHTSSIGMLHLDSSDHAFISLDAASSSHDKGIYFQEAGTAQVIIDHDGSANLLRIHDGTNTHMVIEDGGHIGIGTTNPTNPFHVAGNENYLFFLEQTGTNIHVAKFRANGAGLDFHLDGANNKVRFNSVYDGDDMCFETSDGEERMRIVSGGKVGIGTISPTAGLAVSTSAIIEQVALSSSSNAIAWDANAAGNAYHITTENTTFSAPSNGNEGQIIMVEIAQGGTARTIAWNTVFEFAASTAPTVTATASKTDIFTFRYNGTVWQEIGRVQNMAQT